MTEATPGSQQLILAPSRVPSVPRLAPSSLWLIVLAILIPQMIGSVFNIWYNLTHTQPLLTEDQRKIFLHVTTVYNVWVYPLLATWCMVILFSLRKPLRILLDGGMPEKLIAHQRRVINLPWMIEAICAIGWIGCIPAFLAALERGADPLNPQLYWHLPISFVISACIAITQSFFSIELITQRLLYPVFFRDSRPADTPGAIALSLRGRGLVWSLSIGACPILSLLLMILAPQGDAESTSLFALSVAGISIIFGFITVWLLGQLIAEPVDALRSAAQAVSRGERDVHIPILRADEFGPLISDFNEMITDLKEAEHSLRASQREILDRLAQAAEFRDQDTGDHTERVGKMAAMVAAELGMDINRVRIIRQAAPLHDVGKIAIPDHILLKPGKLTPEETDIMKTHTVVGMRLLSEGRFELMNIAQLIAHSHHERWDGGGYPRAIAKDEIPVEGQIVAVVDVFDALTHARPYKKAWPMEDALAEIEKLTGAHFSPDVVRAFMRIPRESLL